MTNTNPDRKRWRLGVTRAVCGLLPPIVSQQVREVLYPTGAALRDDVPFTVAGMTGSVLKGSTGDYHAYRFGVHGYFEWRNIAIARALCPPGSMIIEIGANVGTETLGFADVVGPAGRVVAFEPVASNLELLGESLRLNPGLNVTVSPLALGDRCATLRFALPPKDYSGVGHLTFDDGAGGAGEAATVDVACVTLDSLTEQIGPSRAIFMDVEGAEMLVLRGARSYVAAHRPAVILEADRRWLARSGFTPEDLCAELASQSYRIYRMTRLGLSPVDPNNPAPGDTADFTNWLALHESEVGEARRVGRMIKRCGLFPCIAGLNPLAGRRRPRSIAAIGAPRPTTLSVSVAGELRRRLMSGNWWRVDPRVSPDRWIIRDVRPLVERPRYPWTSRSPT